MAETYRGLEPLISVCTYCYLTECFVRHQEDQEEAHAGAAFIRLASCPVALEPTEYTYDWF